MVQLFFSFCFRVSFRFRSLGGDARSDGLLRGRPRVFPTFVPFGWDSQPPFDCPWFSFGNKLNTFFNKACGLIVNLVSGVLYFLTNEIKLPHVYPQMNHFCFQIISFTIFCRNHRAKV